MDRENEDQPLRRGRHKIRRKNKQLDRVLNYLIALVSILIVISAYIILTDSKQTKSNNTHATQTEENKVEKTDVTTDKKDVELEKGDSNKKESTETEETTKDQQAIDEKPTNNQDVQQGTTDNLPIASANTTVTSSTDPIVEKVLVNPNWQPTPTTQTGSHLSSYDENSPDWKEKIATFLNVAGLTESQAIIWSVQNNGSPQTAIGVISSKDKKQKYRVYIEWVDKAGWKPTQIEVLKTLEGAY